MKIPIPIPTDAVAELCRRWKVAEFSLFGSVLRQDFGASSDVDVLVKFQPDAASNADARLQMLDELEAMFGRKADFVIVDALRNPYRRHEILTTRRVLYAA